MVLHRMLVKKSEDMGEDWQVSGSAKYCSEGASQHKLSLKLIVTIP